MFKIKTKILSPMEKCFIDESLKSKKETLSFKSLRGQPICFQLAYVREDRIDQRIFLSPLVEGELSQYTTVKEIIHIPSTYPAPVCNADKHYLRKEIGLYPDPIRPLHYNGQICIIPQRLHSLWFEIQLPENFNAGKYTLAICLREGTNGNAITEKKEVEIELLDISLPKQELIHTEWFYCDCIAEAHHVEVFSEEHFLIIEKYLKTAVKNGINMILTPLFTPELDTHIGGERLTTQLVKIKVLENGEYEFDFTLVEKWVKMCLEAGAQYFEIPHFYTQWGAAHAPKIVAEINGVEKKIFGWETDSLGKEYKDFLSQFIPAIVNCMKSLGVDEKCFYHISDEPHSSQLEHYMACKAQIEPYLKGYNIIDALSDYSFYTSGAVTKPVPFLGHISPFIKGGINGLWTYYSGACAGKNGTGRCHGMPSSRTRILGVLLYQMNIEGFLHWGYNFFHNFCSYNFVNPFAESAGEYFAPTGDAFLVYPGDNEPLESQRLVAMRQAMEDHRLLKLYESKFGREKTLSMLKEIVGYKLTPHKYPREDDFFTKLLERVIKDIQLFIKE